jgi:hypothetical protein
VLPFNRLYIAFVRPDLVYTNSSLETTGINLQSSGDYGFAILKDAIAKVRALNIEVHLSVGGWDSSCNPYFYM